MALPPVEQRTLRAAYDRALAEVPDELAQLDRTSGYTTAESHERSMRVAGGFGALGVGRQEPVAALLEVPGAMPRV